MSKPEYMSQEAYNQRVKAGFKKNPNFSGEWTMVRIRKDVRDKLKAKFGTFTKLYEFALNAKQGHLMRQEKVH